MKASKPKRSGIALIAILILLMAIVVVMTTITWSSLATRRALDRREHQLQAEWLARGGIERVHAQAASGVAPRPQTWQPLGTRSTVQIEISGKDGVMEVTSEGVFPVDEPHPVKRDARGQVMRK